MGYSIRRVDRNQSLIVEHLRGLGANVLVLSTVGHGCPDILVGVSRPGKPAWMGLVEIKDGAKPLSAQKLTGDELVFHDKWYGFVYLITSIDEATALFERAVRGEI